MRSIVVSLLGVFVLAAVACEGRIYLFKDSVNWFEAQERCRACGKQLANIDSDCKTDEANALIRDHNCEGASYWIDGTDLSCEGTFKWWSTGNALCYTNWQRGQPDDCQKTENCILINNGLWYDAQCTQCNYYLCEDDPCHC